MGAIRRQPHLYSNGGEISAMPGADDFVFEALRLVDQNSDPGQPHRLDIGHP